MFAIVDIAGQQFKVEGNQTLFVHRQAAEEGATLTFDKVLMVNDTNNRVTLGAPHIENAQITARVLSHLKGDKVIVFRKKRRKGYRKLRGHRQQFTKLQIESISF
jgi:large subunit ribosomal protein L21